MQLFLSMFFWNYINIGSFFWNYINIGSVFDFAGCFIHFYSELVGTFLSFLFISFCCFFKIFMKLFIINFLRCLTFINIRCMLRRYFSQFLLNFR
eukprot:UN25454